MADIVRFPLDHTDPLGAAVLVGDDIPPTVSGGVNAAIGSVHLSRLTGAAFRKRTASATAGWANFDDDFNVLDYYLAADGTNDALAVNRAITAAVATGGTVRIPPRPTSYLWQTPIDLTSTRTAKGIRLLYTGAHAIGGGAGSPGITIAHTGVGIDCTGSSDLVFDNISLNGDATTTPKCGWLLAREGGAAGTAGRHRFFGCRTRGFFTAAALWSYASEENDYFGCFFYNQKVDGKAVVLTGSNRTDTTPGGVSSSLVTVSTGAQSNLINNFHGGSYWVANGTTTATDGSRSDAFYLESASDVNFYGPWALAGGTAPGRALIYVDGTNGTSDNVHVMGFHGENVGSGLHQQFFLLFGNEAVRTHVGWAVRDVRSSSGATRRTGVTVGTVSGSANITSAALFTAADQGAVIIGAGIPEGTRIRSVTTASAAVLTANATATGSPSCEIIFRLVFAPPNVVLDTFTADANPEPALAGYQFSAAGQSIVASYIRAPNSFVRAQVIDRTTLIGNSTIWTITASLNSVKIDTNTGFIDAQTGLYVNGTKVVGFQTGSWVNQTAVASKADLGAAPTVGQLAAWASAIDAMLKAHGLIST